MRQTGLFSSTAFRTSLVSGLLFVILSMALMALVYATATTTIEQQMLATAEAQARAIEQTLDEEAAERERPRWPVAQANDVYRFIVDPRGKILVSEITPVGRPTGRIVASASQVERAFSGAEHLDDSGLVGFGIVGRDGGYVFVGQEDESLSELREALLATLAVASVIAVILSVGWGLLVAWLSFRRIDRMNAVAAQVMTGDMAPRMPVGRRGDEIDVLATQLNHMLDQLDRVMEAIKQVSADIAHDLRTPLSRLQRRLERLAEARTADERSDLVDEALTESRRMLDVFASLLRISQIEGGGARRQFARLDLSEMLTDVYETYEPVFADSGHALQASIERGIEMIGDRALLQQMFVNLLENIIAHTPTGTSAELILVRPEHGGWRATVHDDGPGIAIDHQNRVFTRFYRVDPSRSTDGSGLGLALVKAVADAHDLALQIQAGSGFGLSLSSN